jgi:predicted nuclease of restriction endonuclease-like (RecB) superfamily
VDNTEARNWYCREATEQTWSARTLDRNISTQYYFRLLSSQNKTPVIAEMEEKTAPLQADKLEFIKNPVVAEFLGLSTNPEYTESNLESAIIGNLQKFIMEMGKGYAFVARQQHIHTVDNDYYIDLVFYNYIIKCFVLIDLKVNKITYQDVGQMDMYLQMYDKNKKGEGDNPTIGIILCADTDQDVAEYSTLSKNDQMFAAKYIPYLPTKEELKREIDRQKMIFKLNHEDDESK